MSIAPARGTDAVPGSDAHLRAADQVARDLGVDVERGLADADVLRRRATYGPNLLEEAPRRRGWLRFADQFRSVLILILLGAAVLAGAVGDLKTTAVIAVVLLVNATLGFVQENRAVRSLDALKDLLVPSAQVRRAGAVLVVPAAELVPGDVVLLTAGDRVPADGRLLVARDVDVDESALTGESQPVSKGTAPVRPSASDLPATSAVPLADRTGMAYMTTSLTRGRAELVVTATGMRTEVGAIADLLQVGDEPATPLQVQLDAVGKRIALIGGVAVTGYAALALLRGEPLSQVALSGVALAVATVPEGLPAVLALTLALGVGRMARRGAVVKRLASVETLGSATIICTDKTGTLTLNQMTARELVHAGRHVRVEGEGYSPTGALVDAVTGAPADGLTPLLEALVLCSDAVLAPADPPGSAAGIVGDPTEGAVVVVAAKAGLDAPALRAARPRTAELPFDSARKYMATVHVEGAQARVYVKGAPDVLLARVAAVLTEDGVRPLDEAERAQVGRDVTRLASRGLRVLAAATVLLERPVAGAPDALARQVDGLVLLGLVGVADPPRPQARDAIALAHRAGVAVKMITGDHRDTAAAIARELGIGGEVLTGAELDAVPPAELGDRVEATGVFARVSPQHKVTIVRALTARGHVVAMTGDGVNDAAALRAAHMGVAMGLTGTEVTRQAGDMILTDDDFATIVEAVHEGRSIYDNVIAFVRFQLATNVGAILAFLGATAVGLPAPLNAVQILWVNIIMDGPPAMALGVDPPRPGLMNEPPRHPGDRILDRSRLVGVGRAGLVMAAGTLGVLAVHIDRVGERTALTMAFTTFVLFQFFNALNARAERGTVFTRHLFANRWLWGSLAAVVALQVLVVQLPLLQSLFDTTALTAGQWLLCAAVASTGLVVEEILKLPALRPRPSGRGTDTKETDPMTYAAAAAPTTLPVGP